MTAVVAGRDVGWASAHQLHQSHKIHQCYQLHHIHQSRQSHKIYQCYQIHQSRRFHKIHQSHPTASYKNTRIVIPTKVGIRNVKSRETVLSDKFLRRQTWIPAYAGMTEVGLRCSETVAGFCRQAAGGIGGIGGVGGLKPTLHPATTYPTSRPANRLTRPPRASVMADGNGARALPESFVFPLSYSF